MVTDTFQLQRKYDNLDRLLEDAEKIFPRLTGDFINLTRFGVLETKKAFYSEHLGLTASYYFAQVVKALPIERLCTQLGIDVTSISFYNCFAVFRVFSDRFDADRYLLLEPLAELTDEEKAKAQAEIDAEKAAKQESPSST
jgi:hypothetical protein